MICIKHRSWEVISLAAFAALASCAGIEVRFMRMRYLSLFLATMLFASNAAAALRACVANLAPPSHAVACVTVGEGGEQACAQPGDADACLNRCIRNHQSDEQTVAAGAPVFAPVPGFAVRNIPLPTRLRRELVVVEARPIVGPPLTILFGNLRH